jgi:hypothetical protein
VLIIRRLFAVAAGGASHDVIVNLLYAIHLTPRSCLLHFFAPILAMTGQVATRLQRQTGKFLCDDLQIVTTTSTISVPVDGS